MKRPKLLLVTTVPDTLVMILREQPKFLSQYFDVHLCTGNQDYSGELVRECVPVHIVPMVRRMNPLKDLQALVGFVMLLRRIRPDIVHSYTPKAGFIAMIASALCGVENRIHTFTGLLWPTSRGALRRILRIVDMVISASASQVLAESEGVRSDLYDGNITKKPIDIIGRGNIAGVEPSYFDPTNCEIIEKGRELRQGLGLGPEDFLFAFIGRLTPDKGVNELISSVEEMPETVKLAIVGEQDAVAPLPEPLLKRIERNRNIHPLGFMSDIRSVLSIADCVVLPSYREGFPNVVLQAGAMAKPVLATRVNGSKEIIEPYVNGWLIEPRSIGQLKEKMLEILEMPSETMQRLGWQAREIVTANYSRQIYWGHLKNYYDLLLCSRIKTPGESN